MVAACIAAIGVYRRWVSPLLPSLCRFQPTCSAYAVEALAKYGLWHGGRKAVGRLLRCHPWGGFGYDPVD
jgi:putative membrane protein insertion efficiency factor